MEQKIKFIILGLIGILVISLFIAFQNYSAKDALQKERDKLVDEKATLSGQLDKLQSSLRSGESKINSLNSELSRVSQEKKEIERKYDLAKKGQEELMEKLKSQQQAPPVVSMIQPQAQAVSQTTDAYWAGILRAKTDLELQLGNLRSGLKSAEINNEQLQREKSTLELDMNTMRRDNDDLRRQLEYNQKLMDSISQELVREKNDKTQIQDTFKLIRNENNILARQLKSLSSRKIEFENELQKLQTDKSELERRLTEMETMLTDKISKIGELKDQLDAIRSGRYAGAGTGEKESVELPPIVVRPQAEVATIEAQASPTGKVLAVNKDNNFVIIDLGEDSGVKVGDIFQVYRQNQAIAVIEVIRTRKTIAACDIKRETKPIAIGDAIK